MRLPVGREPLLGDDAPELLGEDRALLDVRLGEDQHELLAAVPADHVGRPKVRGDRLGDAPQHVVAGRVAVGVVDGLEVVDVDEGHRQRPLVAVGPLDLVEQLDEQRPPVGDAGQLVGRRRVGRLGELVGDRVDRPGESIVEAATLLRCLHRDLELACGQLLGGLHQPAVAEHDVERHRAAR